MSSHALHVILGAGPSGAGLAKTLHAQGRSVRVVTRSGRAMVPEGVSVVAADAGDAEAMKRACAGARVVFGCVGLPSYAQWTEKWPGIMAGMLAGAEAAGARFVFMDNLYMYGPVNGPIREDLPLTDHGVKPALRADLTRMWQRAHATGHVRSVAVRASDFYGLGVRLALMGDYVVPPALSGKAASLLGDPSQPHTFAYMPDVVRALVTLADAPDDAYGQAWHVPSAPALPVREIVERIYRAAGHPLKTRVVPGWVVPILGLFNADMRELRELMYQWTRPFVVDHAKFAARFWGDYTPMEVGIPATVEWFRTHLVERSTSLTPEEPRRGHGDLDRA